MAGENEKPKDDLMFFDESPEKQPDLMCFDEAAPSAIPSKMEINLLEIDDNIPPLKNDHPPLITNQMSDLNRVLEQTKEELVQHEKNLKKKEGEVSQVLFCF